MLSKSLDSMTEAATEITQGMWREPSISWVMRWIVVVGDHINNYVIGEIKRIEAKKGKGIRKIADDQAQPST